MDRKRMRGILSQMHKIKSPQKNIKRLQIETFPYFFILCLYRVIKDSREKMNTKICATHITS